MNHNSIYLVFVDLLNISTSLRSEGISGVSNDQIDFAGYSLRSLWVVT